jgi:hypothetical protein
MQFTIPEITVVLETWHLVVGYIIIAMISSRLIYRLNFHDHNHLSDEQNRGFCAVLAIIWPATFISFLLTIVFCILFIPNKK